MAEPTTIQPPSPGVWLDYARAVSKGMPASQAAAQMADMPVPALPESVRQHYPAAVAGLLRELKRFNIGEAGGARGPVGEAGVAGPAGPPDASVAHEAEPSPVTMIPVSGKLIPTPPRAHVVTALTAAKLYGAKPPDVTPTAQEEAAATARADSIRGAVARREAPPPPSPERYPRPGEPGYFEREAQVRQRERAEVLAAPVVAVDQRGQSYRSWDDFLTWDRPSEADPLGARRPLTPSEKTWRVREAHRIKTDLALRFLRGEFSEEPAGITFEDLWNANAVLASEAAKDPQVRAESRRISPLVQRLLSVPPGESDPIFDEMLDAGVDEDDIRKAELLADSVHAARGLMPMWIYQAKTLALQKETGAKLQLLAEEQMALTLILTSVEIGTMLLLFGLAKPLQLVLMRAIPALGKTGSSAVASFLLFSAYNYGTQPIRGEELTPARALHMTIQDAVYSTPRIGHWYFMAQLPGMLLDLAQFIAAVWSAGRK